MLCLPIPEHIQTCPSIEIRFEMIAAKPFPPGIHVPCLTWFSNDTDQEIDWTLQKQHLRFLISSGLHGGEENLENCLITQMVNS